MKQVSIRECESYDYDILKKSFEYLISDIGPLENFIKPNSKVLIKPNLVIKKSPEEGATTHPVLVRVVCEELLKLKGAYYDIYYEQFKDFNLLEKEVI